MSLPADTGGNPHEATCAVKDVVGRLGRRRHDVAPKQKIFAPWISGIAVDWARPFRKPTRRRMTPEERERTIEFIIQSQARLATAQEQDRQDRLEFEKWATGLTRRIATLIEVESQRLDRQDEMLRDARRIDQESQKRNEEWQKRSETRNEQFQRESLDLQREALRMLHHILDRLTQNPNSSKN